jgi:hypothetical protein
LAASGVVAVFIWPGFVGRDVGEAPDGVFVPVPATEAVPDVRIHLGQERRGIGDSDTCWEELLGLIDSGAGSEAQELRVGELLKQLATEDPVAVLELAAAEPVRARRLRWMSAALEGWSAAEPGQAADWVTKQFQDDLDARDVALGAVVRGAARQADLKLAEAVLARVNAAFPEGSATRRWEFVAVLGGRGEFAGAVDFAMRAGQDDRGDLLQVAFGSWACARPEEAATAVLAISDAAKRGPAWDAVVARWAAGDPEKLTMFAVGLRDEPARRRALAQALPQWILRSPAEATAWLERRPPSAELDPGAAAVGSFAPLARQRPEVAMEWAESIVNADLRRQTVASVMCIWMQADPAAAGAYAAERP